MNKEPQFRIPWIVIDRDEVIEFDAIIKEAEGKQVSVAWSNPCIEIWFHAYLEKPPHSQSSVQCCKNFNAKFKKVFQQEYDKADKALYEKLITNGDETEAIRRAKEQLRRSNEHSHSSLPSEIYPATAVFKVVEEIKSKGFNSIFFRGTFS